MTPLRALLVLIAALGLSGCDWLDSLLGDRSAGEQNEAVTTTQPPAAESATTDIAQDATSDIVVEERVAVQSVAISPNARYSMASVARLAASPVPVLGPAVEEGAAGQAFMASFRPTDEGYFALMPSDWGTMQIAGTRRFASRTGDDAAGADYPMRMNAGAGSVTVAFGRFGVDYLLELECADAQCPDEGTMFAFANQLVVVGGGQ
jgi:hypothetical protein